jgi:hypothetical protein
LGRLDKEAQVVDLVFEVEEVGLELLFGDVLLGVETHVAVLLGLFRRQALGQIGEPRLQLLGSSIVAGELLAHALQGLPWVLKERPHVAPNEVF